MHHDQGSRGIGQGYRNTIERSRFLRWPSSLSEETSGGIPGHAYCPCGDTTHGSSE